MKKKVVWYVWIILFLILSHQTQAVGSGPLFQVQTFGAFTNGLVNITLCLNAKGPISCQTYDISELNLIISTTINHVYPYAGIKINTPGYTIANSGIDCVPNNNGFCIFSVSNAAPATILLQQMLASNSVNIVVDSGPAALTYISNNNAFVSVKVCYPSSDTDCVTIDHITVDTGSTGLRLLASVFTLPLPQLESDGNPVAECFQFSEDYTWGSVRVGDVILGGEKASSISIQLVGDPMYPTVPTDCSDTGGVNQDTVDLLGGNGIIGVGTLPEDCGVDCAISDPPVSGAYYTCSMGVCSDANIAVSEQVSNPIVSFATDNNGVVINFPTIPIEGATVLMGTMTFGIGTQFNNTLHGATVYPVSQTNGYFTTIYNGTVLTQSFIDSGTTELDFSDDSIPICTSPSSYPGYYCPSQTLNLPATNKGYNGVGMGIVDFMIAPPQNLSASATASFLGAPFNSSNQFVWGLPFFYGRTVFTAIVGQETIYGPGPYFAY